MLRVIVIFLHVDIKKFHVNTIMLHVDIKKFHVNTIMLHVDINHLAIACKEQKYAIIGSIHRKGNKNQTFCG